MSAISPDAKNERSATGSPELKRRADDDESGEEEDVQSNSGSKYKKLASGKRADQNRKAQRAFRQRKDKYIKDLELRSQELDIANTLIVQLKEENDRLNEIAKSFHSRVGELETQLAQVTAVTNDRTRRDSGQYKAAESNSDNQYYSVRGGRTPRDAKELSQAYTQTGHVGSVYSQTQGLL